MELILNNILSFVGVSYANISSGHLANHLFLRRKSDWLCDQEILARPGYLGLRIRCGTF